MVCLVWKIYSFKINEQNAVLVGSYWTELLSILVEVNLLLKMDLCGISLDNFIVVIYLSEHIDERVSSLNSDLDVRGSEEVIKIKHWRGLFVWEIY